VFEFRLRKPQGASSLYLGESGVVQIGLAPVIGNARIDVLDMLRGIAILGFFR